MSKKKKNVSKKSLNNFIRNLEREIKKNKYCFDSHVIPQHEFIDEAKNYWDDMYDEAVESVREFMKVPDDFKKENNLKLK